jgi:hypothetical protein
VALGNANSRMKDFYDVWIYSNHLDFNTDMLLKAIDATPLLHSIAHGEPLSRQWKAGHGWAG